MNSDSSPVNPRKAPPVVSAEQSEIRYKAPALRKNFSWSFLGNGLYTLSQWGMITVLAKLGTQQMVGLFALGLAIATPVILFANMQLNAVQVTDVRRKYRFGTYIALRLLTTTLALLVILGIALFTRDTGDAMVVALIAIAKSVESVGEIFYGLYMQNESMERLAKSMIIKGALSLLGLAVGIYLTGNLVWGVFGMGMGWLLVLLFYDLRNGADLLREFPEREAQHPDNRPLTALLSPRWEPEKLLRLGRLAFPMGVLMMLISLNTNIPRYFIEHYSGADQLGVFAAMSYVVISGYMVIRAAGQATSPRIARHYSEGDIRSYVGIIGRVTVLSAAIGITGVFLVSVAGREILTILYTPEYANSTGVFLLMMVAASVSFIVSALGLGVTAAQYFASQVPVLAVSSGVVALVCWWLVPFYGLSGAAAALIIGTTVQALGTALLLAHSISTLRRARRSTQ